MWRYEEEAMLQQEEGDEGKVEHQSNSSTSLSAGSSNDTTSLTLINPTGFSKPKSKRKTTKAAIAKARKASVEHIQHTLTYIAEHDHCDLKYLQVESFHYVTAKMEIAEYPQEHQDLHSAFDDIDRLTLATLRSSHIVTIMYHYFPEVYRKKELVDIVTECRSRIWAHATRRLMLLLHEHQLLPKFTEQFSWFQLNFPHEAIYIDDIRFARAVDLLHHIIGLRASKNLGHFMRVGALLEGFGNDARFYTRGTKSGDKTTQHKEKLARWIINYSATPKNKKLISSSSPASSSSTLSTAAKEVDQGNDEVYTIRSLQSHLVSMKVVDNYIHQYFKTDIITQHVNHCEVSTIEKHTIESKRIKYSPSVIAERRDSINNILHNTNNKEDSSSRRIEITNQGVDVNSPFALIQFPASQDTTLLNGKRVQEDETADWEELYLLELLAKDNASSSSSQEVSTDHILPNNDEDA